MIKITGLMATTAAPAFTRSLSILGAERAAAATRCDSIGIVNFEAAAHQVFYEIYGSATDIINRDFVDEHFDTVATGH